VVTELEDLVAGFLKHCNHVRGLGERTVEAYALDLRLWLAFLQSQDGIDHLATAFTPAQFVRFVSFLRTERKNGTRTVQRKMATLGSFTDYLLLMEILATHEDPRSRLPRTGHVPKRLPEVLSEKEVERLLRAPDPTTVLGRRDRAILLLLYTTGLRVSELCALTEADFERDPVHIRVIGKGQRERVVPIRPEVRAEIEAYRTMRTSACDALFVSRKGGSLTARGVEFMVQRHARAAGISSHVTPHTLRHSCATHLVRQGVALEVVRRLLGHQSLATTQVYLHLTVEDVRQAMTVHPVREMWLSLQAILPVEPASANQLARAG
jgi:integrase/recombinase XerD